MPLPRQNLVIATVVVVLLAVLGLLLEIGKPVSQINDRMAARDAAIKAQALQAQQGREAWRNSMMSPGAAAPVQPRP